MCTNKIITICNVEDLSSRISSDWSLKDKVHSEDTRTVYIHVLQTPKYESYLLKSIPRDGHLQEL